MVDRWRAFAAAAFMIGLAACGRMPEVDSSTSAPNSQAAGSGLASAPPPASDASSTQESVVLAGGPPASDESPPALAAVGEAAGPPVSPVPVAAASDAVPAATPAKVLDPLEAVNRRLFAVDATINQVGARLPVRRLAAQCSPKSVRAGLGNLVANLQEPTTFANQILQRKVARAAQTAVRFVVNSTAGLFGLFDTAHKLGIQRVKTNFGQTLAAYGVAPGPYLYVPIAGPMTLRDVAGIVADGYLTPFAWLRLTEPERRAMQAAGLAAKPATADVRTAARRADPDGAARDEYAAVRQQHYQQQAAAVEDQKRVAAATAPARPLQIASRDPR